MDAIEAEQLRRMYQDERLSVYQIAKRIAVDPKTVQRWLVKIGIPRRDYSTAAEIAWGSKSRALRGWRGRGRAAAR